MKVGLPALAASFLRNLGALAPALLLLAGVGVWVASGSIRSVATTIKVAQAETTQRVRLERQPIDAATALAAATRLTKLAPSTTVAVASEFVVVSISSPERFAEWVHALTELQSTGPDLVWEVEDMCIASCETGEAAKAYITAHKQRIKVE